MRRAAILLLALIVLIGVATFAGKLASQNTKTVTVSQPIAYTSKTVSDDNLPAGKTSTKQTGRNGIKLVKYKVTLKHGKEVKRTYQSEKVSQEPRQEVILTGTKLVQSGPMSPLLGILPLLAISAVAAGYLMSRKRLLLRQRLG